MICETAQQMKSSPFAAVSPFMYTECRFTFTDAALLVLFYFTVFYALKTYSGVNWNVWQQCRNQMSYQQTHKRFKRICKFGGKSHPSSHKLTFKQQLKTRKHERETYLFCCCFFVQCLEDYFRFLIFYQQMVKKLKCSQCTGSFFFTLTACTH